MSKITVTSTQLSNGKYVARASDGVHVLNSHEYERAGDAERTAMRLLSDGIYDEVIETHGEQNQDGQRGHGKGYNPAPRQGTVTQSGWGTEIVNGIIAFGAVALVIAVVIGFLIGLFG